MDASGSSSHQVTARETMVSEEDPYPESTEFNLVIFVMNPPL